MCRQRLGITQEELAWRANIHRTYIADIERGARNMTLRTVDNLAKALQLTVGNLLMYAADPTDGESNGGIAPAPHQPSEILLIEDNATDVAITARAFKRARIANPLKVVREGEDAMVYLYGSGRRYGRQASRHQLILLDLNLPQMSGVEVLRRIKGDERTADIPVVVLTVSQHDRVIIECGRLGAENYIVKPLGLESLVKVTPKLNLHLTLGPPAGAQPRGNRS